MKSAVTLLIDTAMPERLIERAMDAGIAFHGVKLSGDHALLVVVPARDARRLIALCERYSIAARVVSRRGLCAFIHALHSRRTLIVGIAAFLALCWFFTGRVWRIDIVIPEDAQDGDRERIVEILSDMGIEPGIPRTIDTGRLSDELMARCEGYGHIGAKLEGVRLVVEAVPEVSAPPLYDEGSPRDLYALAGGVVVSVNVEAGIACVKAGDTVRRGQLLIRGEEKLSDEATRGIAARGSVMIRAWFEGASEGAMSVAQLRYTGRVSQAASLSTPWAAVPIVDGERFSSQSTDREIIPIGGLFVPLCIERVTARETQAVYETGDKALLSARLTALSMADARAALTREAGRPFEITESWIRFSQPESNILRAEAVCEITMDAAATREEILGGT